MLRTLFWCVGIFLDTLIVGGIPIIWAKILEITGHDQNMRQLAEKVMQRWGRGVWWLSGSRAEVKGLEHIPAQDSVLLVSNHQSLFDIALLLAAVPRPIAFVAKIELQKIPIVNFWMKREGSIFLDRGNVRQSVKVMHEAIDFLKESGGCLVIFPEGTRSKGGPLGEFKRGSLGIAAKAQVPVVPLCIDGTYKIFEGHKHFKIKAADVALQILPPVPPENLTADRELAQQLRQQISQVLDNASKNKQ